MKFRLEASLVGLVLCPTASAQVTQRVSVAWDGAQGNDTSWYGPITPDARYVGFSSRATNLVPGDTNGVWDVFVRDRRRGITERVSINASGVQGNAQSMFGGISADGRYVGFSSFATNLVPGEVGSHQDVFVHDRIGGMTERVSVDSNGTQGNNGSGGGRITPNGRYVVFASWATNLVPGGTNGVGHIFVRDRQSGTTELVSVSTGGIQGNLDSNSPWSISDDGRYVAFESWADNLVSGDTNGTSDVFVRDRLVGATERVSVGANGEQGGRPSQYPSLSADGRFVTFSSGAQALVPGVTNGFSDILLRDRHLNTIERVSINAGGSEGDGHSWSSAISADGRYVAFDSSASNLVLGDSNRTYDVFVHDRATGVTELVSVGPEGVQGDYGSSSPQISADGRYVEFHGPAGTLVPGDTNNDYDVFIHDRLGGPSFASLCEPGTGGVIPCPCSNPSGGFGQGCDNSSGTGGALLSASGGTYLSSDSLVFTTLGEKPTALSVLSQWTGTNPAGVIFGMGVRCVGGTIIRRLFTKAALGGSITAPDFSAGDPQVSARSAALGDTILPGDSRYYLVYYRDPIVLGGCPASSTFNATQTGQVTWSP